MNNSIKIAISAVIGCGIGVLGTWKYMKRRFDMTFQEELQKEIDKLNDIYGKRAKNKSEINESNSEELSDEEIDEACEQIDREIAEKNGKKSRKITDYKKIIDKNEYNEPVIIKKSYENSTELETRPYIFDPDEGFVPNDTYEHIMILFKPGDEDEGTIDEFVTEMGDIFDDVDGQLGWENIEVLREKFQDCDDLVNNSPSIFIRNERSHVEYEVTYGYFM